MKISVAVSALVAAFACPSASAWSSLKMKTGEWCHFDELATTG